MRRSVGALAAVALSPVVLLGPAERAFGAGPDHHGDDPSITSVSNPRPELASGGDILVRVTGIGGAPALAVDGRPSAAVPHAQPHGSWLPPVAGVAHRPHPVTATAGHRPAPPRLDRHRRH